MGHISLLSPVQSAASAEAAQSCPVLASLLGSRTHIQEGAERGATRSTTFSSYHSSTTALAYGARIKASHHGTLLALRREGPYTRGTAQRVREAGNREPLAHRLHPPRPRPNSSLVFAWILDSSMRNTHTSKAIDSSPDSPVGPSWAPTNPLSPCSCTYMTWGDPPERSSTFSLVQAWETF